MAKTNDSKPNGYALSRAWFDFAFENQELITPTHTAMYAWFIELNNRMGWSVKFTSPASQTMIAIGLKSYNTYKKVFNDLVSFGFVKVIMESRNQYTACIIALSNFDKAQYKALDNALSEHVTKHLTKHLTKHTSKQGESTGESNDSINKQETLNLKPETNKPISGKTTFSPPTHIDVCNYFSEKVNETKWTDHDCNFQAKKFIDFYSSKNWMVGKNKMANWKSAASGWINRSLETKVTIVEGQKPQKGFQAAMDMYNKLKL